MTLKNSQRRPVPKWLDQLEPAQLDTCRFPLHAVLKNSLYYPAAGLDGRPVQFLAGFIHSFIYVDYGVEQRTLDTETRTHGFSGYHLVGKRVLTQRDLAPDGVHLYVPEQFGNQISRFERKQASGFVKPPFATWYIFDRDDERGDDHGPQRFSLVYLCADGVAAYQSLYWPHQSAPEVLAIIQPGTGFGGNYTDFRDPRGLFAWTVLQGNGPHIPEYLVCGGMLVDYTQAFWPEDYPDHIEWFQHVNGNGVWQRKR